MKWLVLLSLVGVALAQVPNRCNTTERFQGHMIEVSPARREERRARLTYDAPNERVHIVEEIEQGSEDKVYYAEWFFHKAKYGLRLNLMSKQCINFTLNEPFRVIGVPSNAKFEAAVYIGTSSIVDDGVLVDGWGADTMNGRLYSGWTEKECIPVTETYISQFNGPTYRQFFDVVVGIPDPNVWVPPAECMKPRA